VLLLKDDPMFEKYFRMLRMHLPRGAVEMKMQAEGVDQSILDLDPNQPSPSLLSSPPPPPPPPSPPPPPGSGSGSGASSALAEYAKYATMLKLHLPTAAVEQKMRAEGILDPEAVINALLDNAGGPSRATSAVQLQTQVPPPPPAQRSGGGGGGGSGGGCGGGGGLSLMDQLKAGPQLKKASERAPTGPPPPPSAPAPLSLMEQIIAARGNQGLRKVTDEEREAAKNAKEQAEKEEAASGAGGIMGAISAALNARRRNVEGSDSDSSSDSDIDSDEDPGDWSASDREDSD